jgi:hypothetical protein
VLEAGDDGLVVAAADGAVRVRRVRTDGAKASASAFADEAGVRPGATFTASSAAGDEHGLVGS